MREAVLLTKITQKRKSLLIHLTDKLQFTEKINNRARVDLYKSLSIDTAKPRIRP